MKCLTDTKFNLLGELGENSSISQIYWTSFEIAREEHCKNPTESWEEIKDKLIEEYLPMCYMNRLINNFERRFFLNIRTQCSKCEGI